METGRPLFIPVILGTARMGRMSLHAAQLVTGELGKRAGVETDLIDIAKLPLPTNDAGEAIKQADFSARMNKADDLVVVSPEYNHGYSGLLKDVLDGHSLLTLTGETAGEGFGTSPSVAGDVDHDGHVDLIVGAWQYSREAFGGRRAYLYSGKDGHLVKTFTCRIPGDTFGFDSVTMGDVDKDGTSDFLITSGWSGVHGFHSGRVFIISSGVKTN